MLAALLLRGLMIGALYASLAVGFSLVFGVAKILNLAHTAFFMLAAYAIFTLTSMFGVNVYLSAIFAVVAVTAIGLLSYRLVIERVREHENVVLLVTVALAVAFQELVLLLFGGVIRGVAPFIHGTIEFLGVHVPIQELLVLGVASICLIALLIFLTWTRAGIALRATAQDREIANVMGIDVGRTCLASFTIAVALAAVAGAVVAPAISVEPRMWMNPLVMMFAAVILGGLGSIKGSFVGAFILAYAEVITVVLVPGGSYIKGSVALALMVLILLLRPEGLFGVTFEEERL